MKSMHMGRNQQLWLYQGKHRHNLY